ncbi:Transmembrane protein [Phytophthora palmivora]|uniref:Transmembrane protein n=1 Tax=Phytophthora palmivora TaxID=4796 RepID=A0A2P4X8M1_9STRA|nr:Transmembrane protein [Phytophthora palmivora]
MYFVIQPCHLERDPTNDYCRTSQLPSSVNSDEKIYELDKEKKMREKAAWEHFNVTYISVNPMPVACSSSGIVGGAYLLLFLPYLIITLFGLRVFQMITHCESFQKNIERIYARELNVPENEVDYWQPMPWDRKRALIVVCSLYITFYVLFIIVMLRDSWGADITIFTSVVLYAILVAVLPSAGKAIFKELFKLIFRQRRKYFRAKAAGGDLKGFSFRLAFILQVLVVVLLTLAQGPIFYIWAFRSCLFLKQFIYYGVLAAIARMSLMGLAQDFAWYIIIKTWGWKDLCPYCTERIKHCDCFNDEVLVLAVQHVGPKWELIRVLDELLAKQNDYEPQFKLYTSEQLRERWDVIVERAENHMEKVEKLRAYREKKRQDALRHDRIRRSFTSFLSFHGTTQAVHPDGRNDNDDVIKKDASDDEEEQHDDPLDDEHMCNLREKKILALNSKIQLDEFEKHYDSNISDVFHALARSVTKRRHHEPHEHSQHSEHDVDENKRSPRTTITRQSSSDSSSSDGETMWVFDTPAQRLERREEEKLQRKRAFRVLKDYNIESVGSASEPSVPAHSALSPSGPTNAATRQLRRQDTRRIPLLAPRSKPTTPRDEDLVILMPEPRSKSDKNNRDNLDTIANAQVEDEYDDEGDSDYPSDLERGHSPASSSQAAASANRVYAVTQRPKTLFRRVSTSATAFAGWALDYDPKAAKEL